MTTRRLIIHTTPELDHPRMVLGLTGWMDGGHVSTGTVQTFVEKLDARPLGEIDPRDFYLSSFPGSMELAAMFRPHVKIEDGVLTEFDPPTNRFHYSERDRLVLFAGAEPQLNWTDFADCIFAVARRFGVREMIFVGSVAGLVPHTRRPRVHGSVSEPNLRPMLEEHRIRPSVYEGPGSFATYLTRRAPGEGVGMINLVTEIPAYIEGRNDRCIETAVRQVGRILDLHVDCHELRKLGDMLEERINESVSGHEELAERIRALEAEYDSDVFDTQMGDLKEWLEDRGIRLD